MQVERLREKVIYIRSNEIQCFAMYCWHLCNQYDPFNNQISETSVLERDTLSGFHLFELSKGQEQRLSYFYLEINQKIHFAL